jgi:anti-sigma B factor antagonist
MALEVSPGLTVRGELDMRTAPELEAALEDAIRESAGALLVDLSAVEFLDSTGLQALLRIRARLGTEDRALVLVCPFGPVRRVFELAGLSDVFVLYESRAAARAALVPAEER